MEILTAELLYHSMENFSPFKIEQLCGFLQLEDREALKEILQRGEEIGIFLSNGEGQYEVVHELGRANEKFSELNEFILRYFKNILIKIRKSYNWKLQGEIDEILTLLAMKKNRAATEKIVEVLKEDNHIFTTRDDEKSEVYIYKDGIYIPEGRTYIKEICREIVGKAYNNHLAGEVIAKIETDTFIEKEEFFGRETIDEIPVENGILNVLTEQLTPYSPNKIFFSKIPIEYNPSSKCPKIEEFLEKTLNKEDKEIFYEIAGFGLFKEYFLKKAIMLVGSGNNGKGRVLALLKKFVGEENICAVPLNQLKSGDSGLHELHKRLFNLAGDLNAFDMKETGLFKSLTGEDSVQIKRKFLRDLKFINYAKMIFACNELPRIYDLSPGFWERWILLEFPYTFVDRIEFEAASEKDKENLRIADPQVIEKITDKEELSGLLNKALGALKRLHEQKRFSYSKGTEDVKNLWIRKSDSFIAFCLDNIEEEANAFIPKKEIRQAYSKYCKKHKVKARNDIGIKNSLETNYGVAEEYKEVFGKQYQEWCWVGIKWKEEKKQV